MNLNKQVKTQFQVYLKEDSSVVLYLFGEICHYISSCILLGLLKPHNSISVYRSDIQNPGLVLNGSVLQCIIAHAART